MPKANKRPVGPPEKTISDDQIEMIPGLSAVLNKAQLANYFGMCENTFKKLEDKDGRINEAYKKGRANKIQEVANNLVLQALEGNTAAAIFYLKTQAGWKETQVLEATVEDKKTLDDFYE